MFNKFKKTLILYSLLAVKTVVAVSQAEIRELQCDCGLSNERTSKIIGGNEADPYKYPWMAAVYIGSSFRCGGALITRQYVLTAAHCLINKGRVFVGIAVHDLERQAMKIPASALKTHPYYRRKLRFYDVGLIKLAEAVVLTNKVGTLCLPHNVDYEQPNRHAIAAGWGRTKHPRTIGSEGSRVLKEIDLEIVSTEWTIIAGGVNGFGVYKGDSGSPLFTRYADGRYHVIGVVSGGFGYCEGLSVYTRITFLNQWIMSNIIDSEPCESANYQVTPNETNHL